MALNLALSILRLRIEERDSPKTARNGGIGASYFILSPTPNFSNTLITSNIFTAMAPSPRRSKMANAIEIAVTRFKEGFVCSESVLMGYAELCGIIDEVIPRIATGFAGGIGRRVSVCGALVGAIMALGLRYCIDRLGDSHAYKQCLLKSSECYDMFEKAFGSVTCLDLTVCDLSTPEGRRIFRESGLREKKCMRYVEEAARILTTLI